MAIGDVYYAKWKFEDSALGTVYVPGIHVRQDGVSFDAAAVAADMRNVWTFDNGVAIVRGQFSSVLALTAILIRRVSPSEPLEQSITTGLPLAGTAATDRYDPSSAILYSRRTAFIGRSYRGRTYWPAPVESAVAADGSLSVATAELFADAFQQLDGLGAVGQLTPEVVWSEQLGVANIVTARRVDRRLRSQRRRQIESPLYVTP